MNIYEITLDTGMGKRHRLAIISPDLHGAESLADEVTGRKEPVNYHATLLGYAVAGALPRVVCFGRDSA